MKPSKMSGYFMLLAVMIIMASAQEDVSAPREESLASAQEDGSAPREGRLGVVAATLIAAGIPSATAYAIEKAEAAFSCSRFDGAGGFCFHNDWQKRDLRADGCSNSYRWSYPYKILFITSGKCYCGICR